MSSSPNILSEGHLYRRLVQTEDGPQLKPIILWHEPKEGKLGTLYYTESIDEKQGAWTKTRTKVPSQSLPVIKIKDVFLGKQRFSPDFDSNSSLIKDLASNTCFSLISKDESAERWHFVAEDEQTKTTTIETIRGFFAAIEAKQKEKAAQAAAAANSNGTESSSATVAPASSNVLAEGRPFKSVTMKDGVAVSEPIFLWHDPADGKLGTLYYSASESDRTKSTARSLPVAKIKDVFFGKQTAELKSDLTKDIPSSTCFSLISKDGAVGLHLIANDDQTRTATLDTIKGFWAAKKKPEPAVPTVESRATPVVDDKPAQPLAVETNGAPASSSATVVESPPPVSDPAASDPAVNIASMKAGTVFNSYNLTPGEVGGPTHIFLWLSTDEPTDGQVGTLYWNVGSTDNKSERSVERSFPLKGTKDVFVGKHAWKKAGLPLPEFPTSRCLSLVSATNSLHLEAPDDLTRSRWANGIKDVFEAVKQKAKEAKEAGTRDATPPTAADVAAAATVPPPNANGLQSKANGTAAVSRLAVGSEFTSHRAVNGELQSKPVFLFYEREADKLGTIYWCDAGKREIVPGQSIPAHKISDVYLGKHQSYRDAAGASNIRTVNCFTLVSRAATVHLEAKNADHRSQTIEEIKSIFTTAGKKVDENHVPKKPAPTNEQSTKSKAPVVNVPAESAQHVLVLPEVPMSPRNADGDNLTGATSPNTIAKAAAHPLPVVATPIADGQDFELWEVDESGKNCRRSPVHVWYEPVPKSLGSLYWASGYGNRQPVPNQVLPLAEITDVFVGRHVEEFHHPSAADIPQDRCISLRSQTHPNHNLNLIASSSQVQRRWIRGLRKAFSDSPAAVIETRPVKPNEIPAEAITSPNSRALKAKLSDLKAGVEVTTVSPEGRLFPRTMLWLDTQAGRAGTLFWSANKEPTSAFQNISATANKGGIAIHTISDVWVGKKTAGLRSSFLQYIPTERAFALSSKTKRLEAFTDSEDSRKKILEAIEAAIKVAGTPLREYQHGPSIATASSSSSSYLPSSPSSASNTVASNPQLLSQLTFIMSGSIVLLHPAIGAQPKKILLWYEPKQGKQGAVYWCDVPADGSTPTKTKQSKQTILLQHLSDVLVGRQSDILKASGSQSLKGENCFSLLTVSPSLRLDIQVADKQERDLWLDSLRLVFQSTQKRIVDGSGMPHVRKLAVGTIVDTFFGRGTVIEPTRKDGITKISLPNKTTGYFNHQSIQVVPLVYTPFGTGVFPVGAEKQPRRADSIRCVELPWAKAYLNVESISLISPAQAAANAQSPNGVEQSRDASSIYLQTGCAFTHVSAAAGPNQPQQFTPIFVYLNPATSVLGSLDYNLGKEKRLDQVDGSIPLKNLSDLLLGKQTPALKALQIDVPDSRCFSIVVKSHQHQQQTSSDGTPVVAASALDLIVDSDVKRTEFIYALFNLLSTTGRKITQQRTDGSTTSNSSASSSSAPATSSHSGPVRRYSFSKPTLPSFAQATTDLGNGAPFKLIIQTPNGERITEDAFVFLQPSTNSLIWSSTYWTSSSPSPKDPIRSIPLASIRDVYYNKKTPIFQEQTYSGIEMERCFSIGTKERYQWNLIANNRTVRDKFFFSLQAILHPSSKTADNICLNGSMFTRWSGEEGVGNGLVSERIFLFADKADGTKYGSLYWNSVEGDRTKSSQRQYPLHALKDVFQGKNSRTLRAKALESTPKDVFFSLLGSAPKDGSAPLALHLQADSSAQRTLFLNALKGFFPNVTNVKSQTLTNGTASSSSAIAYGSPAEALKVQVTGAPLSNEFIATLAATQQRSLHIPPVAAVQFLQTGSRFTTAPGVQEDVFYVAPSDAHVPFGSLYTAAPGSRTRDEEHQYAIHRLERITIVNDSTVELKTGVSTLRLQTSEKEVLASFLSGLQYLLAAAGFRVTTDEESKVFTINDINGQTRSPAVPSLPAASLVGLLEDTQMNGLFPSFVNGTTRTTIRIPVRLFLRDETLYWLPASAGSKPELIRDSDHAFPLASVTRITVGKYGPASVTIQTRESQLDLEAKSQTQLSLWLASLTAILQSREYSIKSDAEGGSDSKRSYLIAKLKISTQTAAPTFASTSASSSYSSPPAAASEDTKALEEFNENGGIYTAYTLKKGKLVHKNLVFWLSDTEFGGRTHLFWGDSADPHALARQVDLEGDNEVEVNEITSIEVGKKSTPTLQALDDSEVAPDNCVSIASSTVKFDLVAESAAQARAIVTAIKNLHPKHLTQSA